jgi:hypothetical protein
MARSRTAASKYRRAAEGGHLDAARTQDERGEQADGPGAQHGGFLRLPHLEPALDLESLLALGHC